MHYALYRKYRPSTFSEVCGQDHVSQTLKNQIAAGKPSHAYLFTGSRGTGKTSSAKILAKAVNCLNPQNGDPCGECEICKGIDSGAILDVSEIDAASNNGVDSIRELRDSIAYAPVKAKYKVYIIDEVHMLSDGAFNALLKTLEEPPEHAIFILATTEVHKIPATIISRCQRYDFLRIPSSVIVQRLQYICDKEGFEADENALKLIAKLADGGMRDAVSMLDLCAGVSGSVSEESVAKSVGMVDKQYIFDIVGMIEKKDAAALLKEINRLYGASCDMERLCAELISHYRDLMVAKTTDDYRELITATNEELDKIGEQSKSVPFSHMMHAVSSFSDCVKMMKSGGDKRTAVETTLIRLCRPELDVSADSLNERLTALESALKSGVITRARVDSDDDTQNESGKNHDIAGQSDNEKPKSAVKKQNAQNFSNIDMEKCEPFENWAEVMEILNEKQPLLYAVMDDSTAYTNGGWLLIDAPNACFRELVNGNKDLRYAIRDAVYAVSGVQYKIGPYKRVSDERQIKRDPLSDFESGNRDIIDSDN